ncbi:MAG: pyridoxal phosphate-dependent aminotransferase [Defluviitaleaceae bacterium]|nr:pyridoxal phosphate-dependent aminotransferase [Defluviitaleaceae bacterium]
MNFDKIINRRGTYSIKYDPVSRGKPENILPMWVADMDFSAPQCVTDALINCAHHGIFGYSEPDAAYFDVVQNWFGERFGWHTKREWLVITPGVVNAIYVAVRALTEAGDGVVIQQPVYYPFESAVTHTGRKLLVNQLVYDGEKYSIDFDDFEKKIKQAKLFILCSPHNPVGRVWTREELIRMGEICMRHNVAVVADEIWHDLIYGERIFEGEQGGAKCHAVGDRSFSGDLRDTAPCSLHKLRSLCRGHHVFSSLAPEFGEITITATAPSKTFNLAGLQHANIFIPNAAMRNKFEREYAACGLSQPNITGLVSCKAAYENGAEWLDELLEYLAGNMSLIAEFFREHRIKPVKPEATYLAWLDCSGLGLPDRELDDIITNKAGLWLNGGTKFGAGGEGFQRINAACPRSVLRDALVRLDAAARS